ncbi:RHS repeat-associated core domain-containing protein [Polyangium sp. y55x31]|uniref:RHS repeat-associated core domain-containing protein n=1 Tax=Polyangium sp. y55x31 TaxID=3042688 RepID=UPI0024826B21|nr:RHS repeat-associated core domain-containing protein [Polyangium sp. y55x31]MDI1478691.1 RHS repeat-associated core domain-containing protein [Polyangium sp. y55x31]
MHASVCDLDDLSKTTTVAEAAKCLYQPALPGVPALQQPFDGQPALSFDALHVAIVHGRVVKNDWTSLANVRVSILEHPEFGYTLTRSNGVFDLVVEGGEQLTLAYEMPGYLPSQRWVKTAWNEYATADVVEMLPRSEVSAPVDLLNGSTAKGEVIVDERGMRQPVVIFQPATSAVAYMPGGTQVLIQGNAHLRVTEYTDGANRLSAMPASLAANVAYTYCASYEIDEAQGAERVVFSKPVTIYLDNFLDFGLPMSVPVGYYDEKRGTWVPNEAYNPDTNRTEVSNAQVVQIVDIVNGKAVLSAGMAQNGSPIAIAGLANPNAPEADYELRELAKQYTIGKFLWRTRMEHFTPLDKNVNVGPPEGAQPPGPEDIKPTDLDDPCKKLGSIIECENQVVREQIPVVGTPFSLAYSSGNVPGRLPALRIPIKRNLHPKAMATVVELLVAGLYERWYLGVNFEGNFDVAWSGHDSMGRLLQGAQHARVNVGYMYPGIWGAPPYFGGSDTSQTCGGGPCSIVVGSPPPPVILWRSYATQIGHWNSRLDRIGGWSLDVHHAYDVQGQTLYLGNGDRRKADSTLWKLKSYAGNGVSAAWHPSYENQPAASVSLDFERVASAPDGTLYVISGGAADSIRRIDPAGIVSTYAPGVTGLMDVAMGPGGALYGADLNNDRVWRINPDQTHQVIAGGGPSGNWLPANEGQSATSVHLESPRALAVAPDGSVYVATTNVVGGGADVIRHIDPAGRIWTVAGNGLNGSLSTVTNKPAVQTALGTVRALLVGPDGTLFIAHDHRISAVGTDGILREVAGSTTSGYSGDGGPANQAKLAHPLAMALARDGSLLFSDSTNKVVRIIEPPLVTAYEKADPNDPNSADIAKDNGVIATFAGKFWENSQPASCLGGSPLCGDGGAALAAYFSTPTGIAFAPNGDVFVGSRSDYQLARISPFMPGLSATDITVPSEGGEELYVFDFAGRHQRTYNALTGHVVYTFDYDPGTYRLENVIDGFGQVTSIDYTAGTITAPNGQVTHFELDAQGYLQKVTNPKSESFEMTYWPAVAPPMNVVGANLGGFAEGLLHTFTNPLNETTTLEYDGWGRLKKDENALLAAQTLDSDKQDFLTTVTWTGPSFEDSFGITRSQQELHTVEPKGGGAVERTHVSADGSTITITVTPEGVQTTEERGPNGTVLSTRVARLLPDPRFGMLAPYVANETITIGSHTLTTSRSRSASYASAWDLTTLTYLETTTRSTSNSTKTSTWRIENDPSASDKKLITMMSPANRVATMQLDDRGRPVSTAGPGRKPIEQTYDPLPNLHPAQPATITAGVGASVPRQISFTYDTKGRLSTASEPNDTTHWTTFGYDAANRQTSLTRPDLSNVTFVPNAMGQLLSLSPTPTQTHTQSFTDVGLLDIYTPPVLNSIPKPTRYFYHPNGMLDYYERPTGDFVEFSYDAFGRVRSTFFTGLPNQPCVDEETYNGEGLPHTLTRTCGTNKAQLVIGYDGALPTSIMLTDAPFGPFTVSWTHYDDLLIQAETIAGHSIGYEYDNDGLLTEVKTDAGELSLSLDPASGKLDTTTLDKVVTDLDYETDFGALTSSKLFFNGTLKAHFSYDRYDAAGRIEKVTEIIDGQTTTYEYVYDLRGQLEDVFKNGSLVADHYDYDAAGNRTGFIPAGGATVTGVPDAQDRMGSYGTATYAYNDDGQLMSKTVGGQQTIYNYDALGGLLRVTLPGGQTINYLNDPQGRRVARLDGSGQLVRGWVYGTGLLPEAEVDSSGNIVSIFVHPTSGAPDIIVKPNAGPQQQDVAYRVFKDHLGSPRLVIDLATGNIVQRIDFDVFGNATFVVDTLSTPGTHDAHPFGFAGGLLDQDTGLVRFGARDYDPTLGRWTTKDPSRFNGGLNLYGYAGNDPVNFIDLDGRAYGPAMDSATNGFLFYTGFGAFAGGVRARHNALIATSRGQMNKADCYARLANRLIPLGLEAVTTAATVGVGASGTGVSAFRAVTAAERSAARSLAANIGSGHGFDKHVVARGEFALISSRAEYAAGAERVMTSSETLVRDLARGRTAFFHEPSGTIVITKAGHEGTMFRPKDALRYFQDLL